MTVIAAHKDIVGGTRDFADGMHGTQTGDSLKAAKVVAFALEQVEPYWNKGSTGKSESNVQCLFSKGGLGPPLFLMRPNSSKSAG